MVFGSIRSGKGYDQVIELARLIRDDPELAALRQSDPIKNSHEIIVAGSVVNDGYVRQLVQAVYGLKDEDMPPTTGKRKMDRDAVMQKLHDLEAGNAKKLLPIELHIDVARENLPALFERANFAYQPVERGATHHSSAIPAVMAGGCITVTTQSAQTPKNLTKGAVLFAADAQQALDIFKQRLDAPQLNAETRKKSLEYANSISPESAARAYARLYNKMAKTYYRPAAERWREHLLPPAFVSSRAEKSL